jgi:hypothetical protein
MAEKSRSRKHRSRKAPQAEERPSSMTGDVAVPDSAEYSVPYVTFYGFEVYQSNAYYDSCLGCKVNVLSGSPNWTVSSVKLKVKQGSSLWSAGTANPDPDATTIQVSAMSAEAAAPKDLFTCVVSGTTSANSTFAYFWNYTIGSGAQGPYVYNAP